MAVTTAICMTTTTTSVLARNCGRPPSCASLDECAHVRADTYRIPSSNTAMGMISTADIFDTNTSPISSEDPSAVRTVSRWSMLQKHQSAAVSVSEIAISEVIKLPWANMFGQNTNRISEMIPPV